jgi:hypothetical protein
MSFTVRQEIRMDHHVERKELGQSGGCFSYLDLAHL